MPNNRKNFKDVNPALEYLSIYDQPAAEPEHPETIKPDAELEQIIETAKKPEAKNEQKRDKRFSLAVQPSLYDDLSVAATLYRTNVNDLCNSILSEYISGNQDKIVKFRELSKQLFK